jgi:hypothetical protein
MGLALLVGALWVSQWIAMEWIQGLWGQEGSATTGQRALCAALMLWRRAGPTWIAIGFALALLWHAGRGGMVRPLPVTSLRSAHLAMVIFLPPLLVWGGHEAWAWWQSVSLTRHLAEPGERLLWLVRGVGHTHVVSNPGPPITVALSHNVLTMTITLMGYLALVLWWGWIVIGQVLHRRTLGRAFLHVLAWGILLHWGVDLLGRIQESLPLVHPFGFWMFPPGCAIETSSVEWILAPGPHLLLYMAVHLSLLMLALGAVGALRDACGSALERLWECSAGDVQRPMSSES